MENQLNFLSRTLNTAQKNYTTTEKEFLSIVEALKEFHTILLGYKINIFADHENVLYEKKYSGRVQFWRILIEEFGPIFHHIKGDANIVADAISRLEKNPRLTPFRIVQFNQKY